jgi:hypothetical protein
MFRKAVVLVLLLSPIAGHAERIPFLVRAPAGVLVVQTHRGDACSVSEEQVRDAANAVVRQAGITPATPVEAPRTLRLTLSISCLSDGRVILLVHFLDDVRGTMTTPMNARVEADSNSAASLLNAVRMATEQAVVDYLDSNPDLSRPRSPPC